MKRIVLLLVAIVVAVFGLVGCGNNGADSGKAGKNMNVGLFWFGDSLDPAHEWDGWTVMRIGAGETLVTVTDKMEFKPQLADKWEVVNPTTWKFHIRDNVKFNNGKPVTAEAVKASLERSMQENTRAKKSAKIANIIAQGQDLIIETTEAYGGLLSTLTEPVYIIIDTTADLSKVAEAPVTTGPYMVTSFKKNDTITVKRNENYWDGKAVMDTITIKNIEDNSKRSMALQSGEMDIIQTVDAANAKLFQNNDKAKLYTGTGVRVFFLQMNMAQGPLQDANVRQAITHLINRDQLAPLFGPGATAGGAPFAPSVNYGYDTLDKPSYDVAKAEEFLKAAGYTKDANGMWSKDGKVLTLVFANWGKVTPVYEAIQNDLKKAGIQVEMKRVQNRDDASVQYGQGFDLLEDVYVSAATNDSLWFLNNVFRSGAKGNKAIYKNERVDQLIEELESEFDVKAREAKTIEIEQEILKDNPAVFIVYPANSTAAKTSVKNLVVYPIDYYLITKDLSL